MTIPDKLVRVATEALMRDHEWDAMARVDRAIAMQLATKDARIALAAAFAALPHCEEVVDVARTAAHQSETNTGKALGVLAALAKEFGDKS